MGLLNENALTFIANYLFDNDEGKDPYLEDIGTLWLLHYNLAKNMEDATSWYFFFNEFNLQSLYFI